MLSKQLQTPIGISEPEGSNRWIAREYSRIELNQRQLIHKLSFDLAKNRPLNDKRVLLNCHVTLATLLIINSLLIAGANVTVIATSTLVTHPQIAELLKLVSLDKQSGLEWIDSAEVPTEKKDKFFDITIDCGGELIAQGVIPKSHGVELTHTDPKLYETISYPVISVDLSEIKKIEIMQGTGNALVEVIKVALPQDERYNTVYKARHAAAQLLHKCTDEAGARGLSTQAEGYWFDNRQYVIFGCGAVGTAILIALTNAGVKKHDLTIIDIEKKKASLNALKLDGYNTFIITKHMPHIEAKLKNAFCVITATGVPNCISTHFDRNNFPASCILINMGTPDEWGPKFSSDDVLNKKKPANFLMEYPTKVTYLDPVFCALIKATYCNFENILSVTKKQDEIVDSMNSNQEGKTLPKNLIPLPKMVDYELLYLFSQTHQIRTPSPDRFTFFARSRTPSSSEGSSPRSAASTPSSNSPPLSNSPPDQKTIEITKPASAPTSPTKSKPQSRSRAYCANGIRRIHSLPDVSDNNTDSFNQLDQEFDCGSDDVQTSTYMQYKSSMTPKKV